MAKYQIEATIEKLELNGENLEIQLKGAGKYLFEKEKDKEYWNILEAIPDTENSKLIKQETPIQINILDNKLEMQHLFGYAFAEKKKFKFELKEELTITAISHVSN